MNGGRPFGLLIGYFATRSSATNLDTVVVLGRPFSPATLRYAAPLAFAALGGLFSERSRRREHRSRRNDAHRRLLRRVGSGRHRLVVPRALLIALAAGGLMGLLHAIFSVTLRSDQIVGGTAINFLALGITSYFFFKLYGSQGTPSDLSTIPNVHLGFLGHGFIGDVFGSLNVMIWVGILLVLFTWIVVFKTPIGLRIRACGEHPRAADTVGIDVYAVRYGAAIVSRASSRPRAARTSRSGSGARLRRT